MLIQAHSGGNGYGYGFGAAGLTQGKDFNCNTAICYAIGQTNDGLLKKLQQSLNVLSGVGGFKPLTVDGFIGAATVAALATLKKIGFDASAYATKETVAANAPTLIDLLGNLATQQHAAAAATGQPSPLKPTGTAVTQLPGMSPAANTLPKSKSKTLWWIAGGLAAVVAVGGVGYVVYRRKGH